MTVNELAEELNRIIIGGQGDLDVIAYCDFTLNGIHYEKPFVYLNDVYYQSGDIELGFSDEKNG